MAQNGVFSIKMNGVKKECLSLPSEWHEFIIERLPGSISSHLHRFSEYPVVNSAFIAGSLQLRKSLLKIQKQK